MDDYDIDDDSSCPKCGHSPIHYRRCAALYCNDGWIDETEYDPLEGDTNVRCEECHGTGIERWCPGCGADLSLLEMHRHRSEMLELLDDIQQSLSRRRQRKKLTRRRVSYIVLPTGKQSRWPRCEQQGCTKRPDPWYYPDDSGPAWYCWDHAQMWWCPACRQFWAGIESFDMSLTGLCENCNVEFDDQYQDDEEDWYPSDYVY